MLLRSCAHSVPLRLTRVESAALQQGTPKSGHQMVATWYQDALESVPDPLSYGLRLNGLQNPFNPSGASRSKTGSGRGAGNPAMFRVVGETNGIQSHGLHSSGRRSWKECSMPRLDGRTCHAAVLARMGADVPGVRLASSA